MDATWRNNLCLRTKRKHVVTVPHWHFIQFQPTKTLKHAAEWVPTNTQFNTKTKRTKMQILKAHKTVNNHSVSSLRFVRFLVTTSCRAVVLPRFGGPEVLEVRPNVDVPDLKPNEILVRTRAVSINPLDTRVSEFKIFSFYFDFHFVI